MPDDVVLEDLVANVLAHKKYQMIDRAFVKRLSHEALHKGLQGKSALKAVRNKLHQVGGAYFRHRPVYARAESRLSGLEPNPASPAARQFCREMMAVHASTAERLPILEEFFQACLAPLSPVTSILDLACGLTPLAIPWMPLSDRFHYHACDIYHDMLGFINAFFEHFNVDGEARPCDLLGSPPTQPAQVAFLLKTLPCLEQVDPAVSARLLTNIQAEHILISYPAHSLSGQRKGMPAFYRDQFETLTAGKPWQIREFTFQTELAFLVTK